MKKRCELEGPGELWPIFLETHGTLMDRIERDLVEAGGPPLTWYDVLAQLKLAPDHMLPMNELADSVLLSRSGVTRLVDRMAHEGLVERAACATDRRVVHARLTEKGKKIFEKSMPTVRRSVEVNFTERLTDAELRIMRTALMKVLDPAEDAAKAS